MPLAQELLMNIQGSGGSRRSFAKEMRALKMRSAMAGHQKLLKNSNVDHSMVIRHLEQLRKVKKLNK